jgi:hypothetical protein
LWTDLELKESPSNPVSSLRGSAGGDTSELVRVHGRDARAVRKRGSRDPGGPARR